MGTKRYLEFKTRNENEYIFDGESCLVFSKNRLDDKAFMTHVDKVCRDNKEVYKENLKGNNIEQYLLKNGFKELLIECTTSCNLRCNYCVFSGNYNEHRHHGNTFLDKETAHLAIMYYLNMCKKAKKYNPNLRPMIGFYGGEPLLNMDIIRYSVEYVKKYSEFKEVFFSLTTNGTLLTKEVIDFLVDNNVHIILSLDGDKIQHDRNRVKVSGEGTFDLIMKNLDYYFDKKKYIFTNTVYDLKTDLFQVAKFFQDNPRFMNIGASPVNGEGTDYYSQFTSSDQLKFKENLNKIKNIFYEDFIDDSHVNKFIRYWFSKDCSSVLTRLPFNLKRGYIRYTGGCVPGDKIFVNVDGQFLVCEKLCNKYCIGNVKDGLDFNKIASMVNDYNNVTHKCENCVIKNICAICYGSSGKDGELIINNTKCIDSIKNFKERLELCYSVLEVDNNWFSYFKSDYYDLLRRFL